MNKHQCAVLLVIKVSVIKVSEIKGSEIIGDEIEHGVPIAKGENKTGLRAVPLILIQLCHSTR